MQLKVRRLPDSVELLIEGTGISPQLQQSSDGAGWQGQLSTAAPSALKLGPQRLSLPEVGLQSISFDGGGNSFSIGVTPMPGVTLSRPVVSADGQNLIIAFPSPVPQASLQVNRVNLARPGAVPLPSYAPPLQPRAVAPPLGDMAVGTMTLRNPGYVNVSGPSVTMTLKNAPARDALMALAQLGGYGFAYVDEPLAAAGQNPAGVNPGARPLSISFRGESYARALNTTLLAAGLQGKLEGNMIFAGPNALSKSFGAQVSKVYRLNQVGPNAAADYLANLGASVTKTNTITTSVTQGVSQGEAIASAPNSQTTQASSVTTVEAYGASTGPLIGLRATTDTRLGTITMVGDPAIVGIAEQYLRQLDLRQRQVALNVKLLDVSLENDAAIDNSFAFRFGNNFIVNNSGQLLGAFGNRLPPDETSFRRDIPEDLELTIEDGRVTVTNLPPGVDISGDRSLVSFGRNTNLSRNQIRRIERQTGSTIQEVTDPVTGQSSFVAIPNGSNSDAIERTITRILGRNAGVARVTATGINRATRGNPGSGYDDNTFFDFVRAQITSGSTKLLASPTLILQENAAELRGSGVTLGGTDRPGGLDEYSPDSPIGRRRANEGVVRVGTNVVTNYQVTTPEGGGNIVCDPEVSTAGLVLGARVEKIDDNGFVTFSLSPSVSAITGQEQAPEGCGSNLNILSVRRLDTGAVRVRDGQTLILTGVISDFDRSVVSKWPILGDIPLIGQFFRNTSNQKEKRELVIMVTPRIINDEQGGAYGYGYQPGTRQVRDFLGTSSF
ncbi:General secretion pathway protein D [Cyanobium sp. NIES-981]|nr:General secretion pathway protein D [Cyanobium sp. NIES-981]